MYFNSKERLSSDSTGIWSVINGLKKKAESCKTWLSSNKIEEDYIFIGHVRNASANTWRTDDAAHPYERFHPSETSSIILAHNGIVEDYKELLTKHGIDNIHNFKSDSEALCAILAKEKNSYVFSEAYGSIATIFHDTYQEGKLWVFRNNGRDLFRGKYDEGMYISSEKDALTIIGCTDIEEFKEYYLYCISNGKIESTLKIKPPPVKVYTPIVTPRSSHYHRGSEYDDAMSNYYDPSYAYHEHDDDAGTLFWDKLKNNLSSDFIYGRDRTKAPTQFYLQDVVGRWIKTDNIATDTGTTGKIVCNEWYFIESVVKDDYAYNSYSKKVNISADEDGIPGVIQRCNIQFMDYTVRKNDFLVAISHDNYNTIRFKQDTSIFGVEGDLLIALEDESTRYDKGEREMSVRVMNTTNGKIIKLLTKWYRIALDREVRIKAIAGMLRFTPAGATVKKQEEENMPNNNITEIGEYYDDVKKHINDIDINFAGLEFLVSGAYTVADIKAAILDIRKVIDEAKGVLIQEEVKGITEVDIVD